MEAMKDLVTMVVQKNVVILYQTGGGVPSKKRGH